MVWIKSQIGLSANLRNMNAIINKYKLDLIGIGLGAIAGFLYWKFVGCASGTCMITSKPLNSSLYGALMGFLIAGMFKKDKI
ncbi:MAG: hypothetical protein RLZ56_1196 [Bacteroidota bacterium]